MKLLALLDRVIDLYLEAMCDLYWLTVGNAFPEDES